MLKHIFLDLDDTIFDFHKAEAIAIKNTLEHFGLPGDDETIALYSAINQAQWHLLEQGVLTRDEVKVRRFEMLFQTMHLDRNASDAAAYYEDRLAIGHYFIDGAEEMLNALHKDFNLFLVTNGLKHVAMSRLNSSTIVPLFDDIFISEAVGHNKPSKEYFDVCFSKIPDFDPVGSLIYGDGLTSDILGGKNAGIPTVWFNPHHKISSDIVPDYEVHSHKEFIKLCQSLRSGNC